MVRSAKLAVQGVMSRQGLATCGQSLWALGALMPLIAAHYPTMHYYATMHYTTMHFPTMHYPTMHYHATTQYPTLHFVLGMHCTAQELVPHCIG